jgi:protein-tyrosine kinase
MAQPGSAGTGARTDHSFEKPDLELMLRGRPEELAPIRVQIIEPAATAPPGHVRLFESLRRHKRVFFGLAIAGAILGFALTWLARPLYAARTVLEVAPSESAEAVAARILDPGLLSAAADQAHLRSLPEYSGHSRASKLLRTILFIGDNGAGLSGPSMIDTISAHLRATGLPSGRVVNLAFRATDPQRAALFLNALAQDFRTHDADAQSKAAQDVEQRLTAQIAQAKTALDLAQAELVKFVRGSQFSIDPQSGTVIANRFAQVQSDAEALRKSTAGSPAADEAARLAATVRQMQSGYSRARAAEIVRYQAERQDVGVKQALYDSLLQRREEAVADANLRTGVLILLPAQPAREAAVPNRWVYGLFGMLAGALLGICFAGVSGIRNRKLSGPGEIASVLAIPELGVVPHAKLDREAAAALHHHDRVIDLNPTRGSVKWQNGTAEFGVGEALGGIRYSSDLGESFRSVLASIWIAGQKGKRPRVLVFASPERGEGKTTMATNLGIALAHTNRRVLIVEANLRQPRLYRVFGAVNDWGLANMLEESTPVEEYAFESLALKTDVPGLYMLPAGSGEMNIASMRYVERLTELLLRFRLEFHAVLIDTPAALEFPDARVVGRLADAAVLVFRCGKTDRDRAAALQHRFRDDEIPVLGAVLNDCG